LLNVGLTVRRGVYSWSHCWQDACVSKLVQYLRESGSRSSTVPSTAWQQTA